VHDPRPHIRERAVAAVRLLSGARCKASLSSFKNVPKKMTFVNWMYSKLGKPHGAGVVELFNITTYTEGRIDGDFERFGDPRGVDEAEPTEADQMDESLMEQLSTPTANGQYGRVPLKIEISHANRNPPCEYRCEYTARKRSTETAWMGFFE
jgi:hypothetical protein